MVSVIYTTINNKQDALRIAHVLVEEQLVACVNIIPDIQSIYRWKGKIEEENEIVLIAKTSDEKIEKTIQRIEQMHTYDLPDIIVLPIIGGLNDYLDYLNTEIS